MCLHTSFSCLCFYLSLLDINKPLCLSALITCLLRSNSQIVQAATTVKSLQLCNHRLQKWNTMMSLNKLKVAITVYTVKWDTSLNQAKSAWIKTLTSTDLAEEGRREVASLDSDAAKQTFLIRLLQNIFFNCLLAYKTSHISNIQVTTAILKPKQTAGKTQIMTDKFWLQQMLLSLIFHILAVLISEQINMYNANERLMISTYGDKTKRR